MSEIFADDAGESDVLKCGDCNKDFPLGDIVHFIHHKVQRCDKEPVTSTTCNGQHSPGRPPSPNDNQRGVDKQEKAEDPCPSIIRPNRTSISAPIAGTRHRHAADRTKSATESVSSDDTLYDTSMTEDDRHESEDRASRGAHHPRHDNDGRLHGAHLPVTSDTPEEQDIKPTLGKNGEIITRCTGRLHYIHN